MQPHMAAAAVAAFVLVSAGNCHSQCCTSSLPLHGHLHSSGAQHHMRSQAHLAAACRHGGCMHRHSRQSVCRASSGGRYLQSRVGQLSTGSEQPRPVSARRSGRPAPQRGGWSTRRGARGRPTSRAAPWHQDQIAAARSHCGRMVRSQACMGTRAHRCARTCGRRGLARVCALACLRVRIVRACGEPE